MPPAPTALSPLQRLSQQFFTALSDRWWCAALLLILPILVIYHDVGHYRYLAFDDPVYIADNAQVLRGLSRENLWWALTTHHGHYWGPVTRLSFMTEAHLFGAQAHISHWINVGLHTGNVLLLYLLLTTTTKAPLRSLAVAILFGIHPLQVESVAWVTERKDVLATFWGFLTLLAYVYYQRQPSLKRYLLLIPLFMLAVCTKPLMVTLPIMMLLLDRWPLQRHTTCKTAFLLMEKLPFLAGSLLVALITFKAQQSALLTDTTRFASVTTQLAHITTDYLAYLGRMLVPLNLAVFYPRETFPSLAPFIASLLGLPLISWYVFRQREHQPYLLVGWLWYIATLLPMSGIMAFGRNVTADRFTYIPSVGIFVMVIWGLSAIPPIKKYIALPALLVLFALTYTSHQQAGFWKNDFTLFQHAVDVTTDNWLAYNNLGNVYLNQRDADEAARLFEMANELKPDHHEILNSLGLAYDLQGFRQKAEKIFRHTIQIYPDYSKPYVNLGSLLTRQEKYAGAIPLYEKAMQLDPLNEKAINNLAALYLLTGQPRLSIDLLQRALVLDPDNVSIHYNLGYAYHMTGNTPEAIAALEQAQRLDPDSTEIQQLLEIVRRGSKGKTNPSVNENP